MVNKGEERWDDNEIRPIELYTTQSILCHICTCTLRTLTF